MVFSCVFSVHGLKIAFSPRKINRIVAPNNNYTVLTISVLVVRVSCQRKNEFRTKKQKKTSHLFNPVSWPYIVFSSVFKILPIKDPRFLSVPILFLS